MTSGRPAPKGLLVVVVPFVAGGFVLDRLYVTRTYVPVWRGLLVLFMLTVPILVRGSSR